MSKTPPDQPAIKVGSIELAAVDGVDNEIVLRRKIKSGQIVEVRISAGLLERWALRQMRDGVFA